MITLSTAGTTPAIRTREQLEAVVENIVALRQEQAELERAQANEIAAVREKYRAPLVEVDRFLQMEFAWAETWARQHPGAFADRLLECSHAQVGFRNMPPRVERANRRWTWTEAAAKLAETDWGRKYLRTPEPEVDREAILADLASLPTEELREAGIKIVQGERFFIEPHEPSGEVDTLESSWQEAA